MPVVPWLALRREARQLLDEGWPWDWASAGVLLALSYGLLARLPPDHRFASPGDPALSYPLRASTVPSAALFALSLLGPLSAVVATRLALRPPTAGAVLRELHHVLLSSLQAWALASALKHALNAGTGVLRPCWFALLATHDAANERSGRLSYPSGHAAYSCAAAAVAAWWLAAALGVFAPGAAPCAPFVRLMAVCAPLALAAFVSASRVHDYRHAPADVNAGVGIGLAAGSACYWLNCTLAGPRPRLARGQQQTQQQQQQQTSQQRQQQHLLHHAGGGGESGAAVGGEDGAENAGGGGRGGRGGGSSGEELLQM